MYSCQISKKTNKSKIYFSITICEHKNVYFIFQITSFRPFSEYKLYYEIYSIQLIKVHNYKAFNFTRKIVIPRA